MDDLLSRLKLENEYHTRVEKLSTGMKQRLFLIRAILHQPKLLFLDEPTSGLDPALTQLVHATLLELKEQGTTIFLTTHQMDEAYKLYDHLALLHQGQIVEAGNPQAIVAKYSEADQLRITFYDGHEKQIAKEELAHYDNTYIAKINSVEEDLASIFIKLTGEKLDD